MVDSYHPDLQRYRHSSIPRL